MISIKKKYKFQICEFTDSTNEDGQGDYDVVPNSWMKYDRINKTMLTAYPNPPYNKRLSDFIQTRSKSNHGPMSSWPWWPSEIKGGADSYKQAVKRLAEIKSDSYGYTTDDGEAVAAEQKDIFIQEDLKSIMAITNTSESSEGSAFDSSESSTTSSEGKNSKKQKSEKKKAARKSPEKKKNTDKTTNSTKQTDNIVKKTVNGNYILKNKNVLATTEGNIKDEHLNPENFEMEDDFENLSDQALLDYASQVTENIDASITATPSLLQSSINGKISKDNTDASHLQFSIESTAILKAVTNLKLMIENIQRDSTEIKNHLFGLSKKKLTDQLEEYNLQFKFNEIEGWTRFNEVLNLDCELKKCFVTMVKSHLDKSGNKPTKSLKNILTQVMTKDFILTFTAVKISPAKPHLFKNYECYNILKDIIVNFHTDTQGVFISEQKYDVALSTTISNAKDWGGREKK